MIDSSENNPSVMGNTGPLVILCASGSDGEYAEEVYRLASEMIPEREFSLAVYSADDWNTAYSPWKWEDTQSGRVFPGGGKETLHKIISLSDNICSDTERPVFIAGYSLAGLFALWSLYECDRFDGCACCSGSLWFDNWTGFAGSRSIKKTASVYLSLGGKEEKTSDPLMQTIGVKTKEQDRLLDSYPNVKKHKYEMNPGGHFSNPAKRLAKGIAWLISNY